MKKLLLILFCLPMIGFGQVDEIIFSSGDTIYGKVIEVGVNDITYQHKDETTNNVTKKRELAKVIYFSGRTETFQGLGILESKIAVEENERLYLKQKEENKKIRIQKRVDRIIYFRELNESKSKNYFVIRTGISIADIIDGDDWTTFKQDNTLGLSAALDAIFSITNRIALDVSIRFSQKNLKTDPITYTDIVGTTLGQYAYLNKINFIDINPNISYKLTKRISFSFGPYLSYAIDGKQKMMTNDGRDYQMAGGIKVESSWTSVNFEKPDYPQYESQVSRLDYGVDIGLSYLLTERIQIKTNYSLGFSDLNIAAEYYGEQDYSQKTSVFYLTIGYILN